MNGEKIRTIIKSEIFLYLFFGVLTTIVNVLSFFIFRKIKISIEISTIIAWALSVLFAFLTNRFFVFHSTSSKILVEGVKFFCSRLFSGVVDIVLMHYLQNLLNESLLKLFVNILIIILNFALSKLFVFNKKSIIKDKTE